MAFKLWEKIMNQTILLLLTLILLHNIIQFTTYWKHLIRHSDWLFRTYIAVSIMLILGGAFGIALNLFKSAPLILLVGMVVFFSAIHKQTKQKFRHVE